MIVRYYFDSERELLLEFIIYAGTQSNVDELVLMGFIPMNEEQVRDFVEELKISLSTEEDPYPEEYLYELSFSHLIRGYMHSLGDKMLERIKEAEINYKYEFDALIESKTIYPIFHFID